MYTQEINVAINNILERVNFILPPSFLKMDGSSEKLTLIEKDLQEVQTRGVAMAYNIMLNTLNNLDLLKDELGEANKDYKLLSNRVSDAIVMLTTIQIDYYGISFILNNESNFDIKQARVNVNTSERLIDMLEDYHKEKYVSDFLDQLRMKVTDLKLKLGDE